MRADPGGDGGLFFRRGGDAVVDGADAVEGAVNDFIVGVGFDGGSEIEIVADGGLVGADLGPLVADEADALGGGEAGFNCGQEFGVAGGGVGGAIVAFAAGIGEEEAVGGDLQVGSGWDEELAVLRRLSFEADGQGPVLRGVGLQAGAEEEAFLLDADFAVVARGEGEQGRAGLGDEDSMILSMGLWLVAV